MPIKSIGSIEHLLRPEGIPHRGRVLDCYAAEFTELCLVTFTKLGSVFILLELVLHPLFSQLRYQTSRYFTCARRSFRSRSKGQPMSPSLGNSDWSNLPDCAKVNELNSILQFYYSTPPWTTLENHIENPYPRSANHVLLPTASCLNRRCHGAHHLAEHLHIL